MSGTINETEKGERRPARAVPYLVVGLECDRPTAGGARFSLDRVASVTIGRGEARSAARHEESGALRLDVRVPAPAMSTSHARLIRVGDDWVIEDRGSTNGTFVNGSRVSRALLRASDVITLGRTLFIVSPSRMTTAGSSADVDVASLTRPRANANTTIDPELEAELDALARVARSAVPVLVRGETGTGKEVLARSVHDAAGRAGSFVAVNCGAIPAGLVESHFFGHVKGAFSGALRSEPGFFRAADGGTLFLDEIGDLPAASQAVLLRALQEREVVPVGATQPFKVDLRVVAASHQPLEAMVARGGFRQDLLARLSGFSIVLPPLRARRLDLGTIVASLLRRLAPDDGERVHITPAAAEALFRYEWPQNVRELEQCLGRALALAGNEPIDVGHLPAAVSERSTDSRTLPAVASVDTLSGRDAQLRRDLLEQLASHRGNLADVSRAMGKARMQIHRWCKRFGIDPNLYRT